MKLTKEEKDALEGLYLGVDGYVSSTVLSFDNTDKIKIDGKCFESTKYEDAEILKKFSNIDGKYYFKQDKGKTCFLVMSNDGILYHYSTSSDQINLWEVYYQINGTDEELEKRIVNHTSNFNNKFREQTVEELKKYVDDMINPLTRGSALPKIPKLKTKITSNINPDKKNNQYDDIIRSIVVCLCILIIIGLIVCLILYCTQSCCWKKSKEEQVPSDEAETHDLSNHYPASTDLVIDVKDTDTIDNTNTNTPSSVSITSEKFETSSTNLFSSALTISEVQEPKSADFELREKEEKHDSHSQEDEESTSTNEMNTVDDFTI